MGDREQWLAARRNGIGGSDIGAILGVSPFKTPVDVFLAKTQPNPVEETNERFYWGHALEQPIIDRFQLDNNVAIERPREISAHPEHKWMIANLDGIILFEKKGVLEVKTVSAFGSKEWGVEGSDEVPLSYVAQCAWYMAVMNVDYAKIAALFGGNDYREFHIDRDYDLENMLISKGEEFWFNHVIPCIAPEPINDHDVMRLFKRDNGDSVECSEDVFAQYQQLKQTKEQAKQIGGEIEMLETKIKLAIGEAATLNYQGKTLATWKTQATNRLDSKALEATHPSLYQQFRKVSESRVLRLK